MVLAAPMTRAPCAMKAQAGLIRADIDLMWARRAYHGLLDAAISPDETETDPDLLAARIVDTLLHGLGLPAALPAGHSLRAAGAVIAALVSAAFQSRARGTRHCVGMPEEPKLTPRELDVMWLVADGRTSKEIGRLLLISPRTVEMHVQSSLRKLGCGTRAGAVWRLASLGALPRPASTRA